MTEQGKLDLNCGEFEVLLADYIDGTLDAVRREALENHMASCAACAEMAQDVQAALSLVERSAVVEPPAELLTKIAFEIPANNKEGLAQKGWRRFLSGWMQPLVQPKFAMGMALTILSFSMLGKFSGITARPLKPADLHPVKVWEAADDRIHRAWARGVKYYESLRIVYELRYRLNEWSQQEEEERRTQQGQNQSPAPNGNQPQQPSTWDRAGEKETR
jgi:hypothetical protein